jgi:hypothetical protein
MNILLQSFQENSVLWIIISAGVGGLIGALIKFIFEQILATRYQYEFNAKKVLRKYKDPILRSADSLDRRLENFIRYVDKGWYDDPGDEYYRLSTLYLFGCYFGWCKILENESFIEFETSNKRAQRFSILYNTVYKGLTGFHYFRHIDKITSDDIEKASIQRLIITAVGELMIKKADGENGHAHTVLDFIEFANCLAVSPDFKKWFGYVDRFFKDMSRSKNSARWNRLLIFATNLRVFVSSLDTKNRQTSPRSIEYTKQMHPTIEQYLLKDLNKQGQLHLVAKDKADNS